MRITKFGHACVRVEQDGRVLVLDPGVFTDVAALEGADAVLITHEHADHVHPDHLRGSDAPIWTIAAVERRLRAEAPEVAERVTVVRPGDRLEVAGVAVEVVGEKHAVIHPDYDRFDNSGYLLEAGIDWMWELTAVSIVAMLCLGMLTGSSTVPPAPFDTVRPRRSWLGIAAAVAAVGLIVAEGIPLLATMSIRHSQTAAGRNDSASALDDALSAKAIQPWAASPYLQIALVREQAGQLPEARAAIADAIDRDDADWRLWLVKARLKTKSGLIDEARSSLERARALNPRSTLLTPQ